MIERNAVGAVNKHATLWSFITRKKVEASGVPTGLPCNVASTLLLADDVIYRSFVVVDKSDTMNLFFCLLNSLNQQEVLKII